MLGSTCSDASEIVTQYEGNAVVDFDDGEGLKKIILQLYLNYKNRELTNGVINIEKYSRKNLTQELSQLMEGLVS